MNDNYSGGVSYKLFEWSIMKAAFKVFPLIILFVVRVGPNVLLALNALIIDEHHVMFISQNQRRALRQKQCAAIDVRKVGLERFLYSMSREQPFLYGLMSLAIAVVAGWGATAAFRLLRQ